MISLIVKNILRKVVIKVATDKTLQEKIKTSARNAKNLKNEGKLMNSVGRAMGRLKNKISK